MIARDKHVAILRTQSRRGAVRGVRPLLILVLGWGAIFTWAPAQYFNQTYYTRPQQAGSANLTEPGDFDNDGQLDLLQGDLFNSRVLVFPNLIATGFLTTNIIPLNQYGLGTGIDPKPAHLQPGGNLDVVFWNGLNLYVMYGNGNGTFATNAAVLVAQNVSGLASWCIRDMNGDGLDDIVVHRVANGQLVIEVIINSYPNWVVQWSHPVAPASTHIAVGDFNGDGLGDIVHNGQLYSQSGGTFVPTATYFLTDLYTIGDLDGDGIDDLVLAVGSATSTGGWGSPAVYWGAATQPFSQTTTLSMITFPYQLSVYPQGIFIGDYDQDGKPDLFVKRVLPGPPYPTGGDYLIFRGLGSRTFATSPMVEYTEPPGSTNPLPVSFLPVFADWDGDGDLDIFGVDATFRFWENRASYGRGCQGTGSVTPTMSIGSPTLGNGGFSVNLTNAVPNSPAVLGVSLGAMPASGCSLLINLVPGQLVLPSGTLGLTTTGPTGQASVASPLPANPALHGATFFGQWAISDPSGMLAVGTATYALTPGRTIILW